MPYFLKGLGDPATRVNEILPRFDANIFHFITQMNPGVCWFDTNRFNATIVDRGVNIGTGMVYCHGYFGMSDATERINVTLPASGTQFCRVFAEVNLSSSPHRFSIRATAQSTSSSIGLVQNNLTTNPSGIHQIPLYLLTINANGTISFTDQRVQLQRLQNSQTAQSATTATSATTLTANINSAVTAVTQTSSDNSTRVATTAFARTAVANAIARSASGDGGIGSVTLPGGVILMWGESANQSVTFSTAFPNQCIGVFYVGHYDGSNNSPWASDITIRWNAVSRTGFTWGRQSGTAGVNRRRFLAIGF